MVCENWVGINVLLVFSLPFQLIYGKLKVYRVIYMKNGRRRDTMFDNVAVTILQSLLVVTILFVVIGIPLGDVLFKKK